MVHGSNISDLGSCSGFVFGVRGSRGARTPVAFGSSAGELFHKPGVYWSAVRERTDAARSATANPDRRCAVCCEPRRDGQENAELLFLAFRPVPAGKRRAI